MRICRLLKQSHVFMELKENDKTKLLEELIHEIKKRDLISNEKVILDEILKRESLGSTGLEKGIAIPHALTDEVKEPFLALSVLKNGVDFEAVDGMPTYVIFLLLGEKKNPGNQLKILAHICRLIKEASFIQNIREAKSADDICAILEEEEGKIE